MKKEYHYFFHIFFGFKIVVAFILGDRPKSTFDNLCLESDKSFFGGGFFESWQSVAGNPESQIAFLRAKKYIYIEKMVTMIHNIHILGHLGYLPRSGRPFL